MQLEEGLEFDPSAFDSLAREHAISPRLASKALSKIPPSSSSKVRALNEWFSWILCHSPSQQYFVVHVSSGSQLLLSEFLSQQSLLGLYESGRGLTHYSPLTSLASVVQCGYMVFFDPTCNSCYFLHLDSGQAETFLYVPRESDPRNPLPNSLQQVDGCWLAASQDITFSWVLVPIQELSRKLSDREWESWGPVDRRVAQQYYVHSTTGHSQWEEPRDWQGIIEANRGWVVCLDQKSDAYFYWSPQSGATQWA